MKIGKPCLLFAMILFFLNWTASLFALDDELLSLRGLTELFVLIEIEEPEIEKDGLTRGEIQRDTEKRLREAGINILSKQEWLRKKEGAYLYVNVNARKSGYGVYINGINLELVQKVLLVRNAKTEVFATTWSRQLLGHGGYLERIRYSIQDMVDMFLISWKKANGK